MKNLLFLVLFLLNSFILIGQEHNNEFLFEPNCKFTMSNNKFIKLGENMFMVKYINQTRYLSYDLKNDSIVEIKLKCYHDDLESVNTDYYNIIDSLMVYSVSFWQLSDNAFIIYTNYYETLITKDEVCTEIKFIDIKNEQQCVGK